MDWKISNAIAALGFYGIPAVITIWTTWRWFPSFFCMRPWARARRPNEDDKEYYSKNDSSNTLQEPRIFNTEKESFLRRAGSHYGYPSSIMGHIDTWRPRELPGLYHAENGQPSEVYLDYAGSALPWQSQLQASSHLVFGNPHSYIGPTASRTLQQIERVRQQLLELWDATPDLLAGFPRSTDKQQQQHPGYHLFFTSGTTEGLHTVAEHFDFTPHQSFFACPATSHTSVLGMRECALRAGASFRVWKQSKDVDDILQTAPNSTQHLVVLPLECNFSGDRLLSHVYEAFRTQPGWCVGLDMAKAACTEPISLKTWDPDFAVVSFYKIFGAPTGLGALLVKKQSALAAMLLSPVPHAYFGGGTVQVVTPSRDYIVRKATEYSLRGGTSHFRGICELAYGLQTLQKLGGMAAIRDHTRVLTRELVRRLCLLRHASTGQSAIVLYGAWADPKTLTCANSPGPTVTFNVLREDGKTYVGYHEIAQLAALHTPPIQFRVGCFCNPGGCQQALGWSDEEIISNFEQMGHVCGDDVDLIEGKPTGAVRISLGKDSMWEDIDVLIGFLDRVYVQRKQQHENRHNARSEKLKPDLVLTELYVFPIKSCAAQRVQRWPVVQGQLWMDRAFCLVNESGQALRLSTHSKMARIRPHLSFELNEMTVTAPGMDPLILSLSQQDDHGQDSNAIRVCGSHECRGVVWGDTVAARWFSAFLGVPCWLARHSSVTTAKVSSFVNEQPILMIRQNAVDAINSILQQQGKSPVSSQHFRPNFVVQGGEEDDSDNYKHWWYKQTICWQVVGPCARCNMVDLDPTSGTKGGSTLRALAEYHQNQRSFRGPLTFGVFLQQVEHLEDKEEPIWLQVGGLFCESR
ncbi:molybdenum cofactor sulfurtransferase [Fistulifera solaris]|uniref:Molybdenum cofactor sulfurtransferase n=1 Tax=Fistulifera solaris TaxID=1519565 RepID=A0A1Z5JC37_FISSO|nr:molybdenum cofactor sulfurtransferase [Fistulifera solaris]|eukprot:GAX11348.1 molybdenum cofactor sulfurtransferase [Fistulifera solaris]